NVSILLGPLNSQPGPGSLLCSVMDFYPAQIQLRCFQGQQELLVHVVATTVVPSSSWCCWKSPPPPTHICPRRGVTSSCQVEH
ncbi:DQB2 protein, partial [Locustella ochotensis]|nr:DQB2 protein [Locustella ochotensis]